MSVLTALARVSAVERGVAQRITTVRHVHLSDRPLVLVPLTLAGEANAPLAVLAGTSRESPELLIVPQPRNRDQRLEFTTSLADIVLRYIDEFVDDTETVDPGRGREPYERCVDAPQILVPNGGGIGFVRLLGRWARAVRVEPEERALPAHLLGRWLTFFGDRAEFPGSSLLVSMTGALSQHWATGQSAVEDANLAALIGWIDPPVGKSGAEAALEAENPLLWPPAGPATDPTFDNEVLAPAIRAYERATGAAAQGRARSYLESSLRGQLMPTWELMWRGLSLLRGLPVGKRVELRWAGDRGEFTRFTHRVTEARFRNRDQAVWAARRLTDLERAQELYDAQCAYDDPLVLAEYRLTGEAFAGSVTSTDPTRTVRGARSDRPRPYVTLISEDPVRLEPGTSVISPQRPKQTAEIVSVSGSEVLLELKDGMGRGRTPEPGSVPEVGERLTYTTLSEKQGQAVTFPDEAETPWTHGGPPGKDEPDDGDEPDDDDAAEEDLS